MCMSETSFQCKIDRNYSARKCDEHSISNSLRRYFAVRILNAYKSNLWKSRIRGQKSELQGPKSEVRSPKSKVRIPKSEDRSSKSEVRSLKSEVWKAKISKLLYYIPKKVHLLPSIKVGV